MSTCKDCGKPIAFPVSYHTACWERRVNRVAEKICDNYCRFPKEYESQDELDEKCYNCEVIKMLNGIGGVEK